VNWFGGENCDTVIQLVRFRPLTKMAEPVAEATEAQPDKHTPLPEAAKAVFQQARREEIKGDVEAALELYTTALEQGWV